MEALAILLAFAVGFAMKYGGLCTYAAAVQIVREGRFERLGAFLGAAAWAGLIVVPLAWWWRDGLQLAATHPYWWLALLGGAVLGLGACFNRGCVFGTFVQLTGGNLSYLATLAGMVAGSTGTRLWAADLTPVTLNSSVAAKPEAAALAWIGLLGLGALMLWLRRFPGDDSAPRSRQWRLVMLTLGIGGGLLFAAVPGWDFAAVLNGVAHRLAGLRAGWPTPLAVFCTLAMVVGGVTAAVVRQRFRLQAPRLGPSLTSLLGGVLMGAAATLVPGGNDGLLLRGIPVLALHAVLGYLAMVAVMLVILRGTARRGSPLL